MSPADNAAYPWWPSKALAVLRFRQLGYRWSSIGAYTLESHHIVSDFESLLDGLRWFRTCNMNAVKFALNRGRGIPMSSISGLGSNADYVTKAESRSPTASVTAATATSTGSISLSTDAIDFALNGEAPTTDASNSLLLYSTLNADILGPQINLSGVGSAIDAYISSLASSNVYDSSYTTPSAKFLQDLADLQTAATSGNQASAESTLAAAKADTPDSVAGGEDVAVATGDTAGLAGLQVEATANISDYLKTQGYSSTGATAEASAIIINGDSLNATFSTNYTPQMRLEQINDLALFAGENGSASGNSVTTTANSPLFNIYETLLEAKSGTAIDESLTNLDALYGGGLSSATSITV
jgi:hypothetical protein